ncbi:MAG: hypothetical protein COT73_13020 [Bdellovibrio sp. CG10_big_fil_rev_8_21_14_0_10_47_8]|nr:MAG: hypothetical protein COT73_13020 [Bdellovibrio sp. CG10_big_fil_rev_8_21_14_0_10_47_8]
MRRIALSIFVIFFSASCAQIQLRDGAEKIKIVESVSPSCMQIGEGKVGTTIGDFFESKDTQEQVVEKAKNAALDLGAHEVIFRNEKTSLLGVRTVYTEYYSCQPLQGWTEDNLDAACDYEYGVACAEISKRSQELGSYSKMKVYIEKACKYRHQPSCEWLKGYVSYKAKLKKSCLAKDGEACFAAAKLEDVDQDTTLMMTFLKQGCSYGHSESCFYKTYVEEKREQDKESRDIRYRQYMVNLQSETLRRQRIANTLAVLNQIPKTTNCTSRKNFDGSVSTVCN